jgi:hypothetical protein
VWFVLTRRALVAAAVEYNAGAAILTHGKGEEYQLETGDKEADQWVAAKDDS